MTRKHFKDLAEAIKYVADDPRSDDLTVSLMIQEIMGVCRRANSNFDSARFLAAIGR
jgi:hypothetical protein